MNEPIYSVFISSTRRDLETYRAKAKEVCQRLKMLPVGMEEFTAMNAGATQGSQDQIRGSSVYVGIFAHRYGYVEAGHDRSVTEKEFDCATELGIPQFCFLVDSNFAWPEQFKETGRVAELERFRQKLETLRIVAYFTTPEDFGLKLVQALSDWKLKQIQRHAEQERAHGVKKISNIPREPSPHFTGREAALQTIQSRFSARTNLSFAQTQALSGLGGIGKTETAMSYAARFYDEYTHIFWCQADTEAEAHGGLSSSG